MQQRILRSFSRGIKPAPKIGIVDWAKANVKLLRSSRSTFADLHQTPWLVDPLEAATGNEYSEILLKAPVGSGKTTLLEILACYIVAEKPGPAMFAGQGDSDAREWMDSGLFPSLKNCPLITPLWPKDRHSIGKSSIQFPHMPLFVCGANLSNFQARSLQYAICDEAWMLKAGLLNELRRRNHDRYGSKTFLLGQAGSVGTDFENAFEQCELREFQFKCPSCSTVQPWRWENLKWDALQNSKGEYLWDSVNPVYRCECGAEFEDTPEQRRKLSDSGRYVSSHSENPVPGHVAFNYNALAVWWIPWQKLVREWLQAQEAKRQGNVTPLRQFLQKRLAQAWTELQQLEAVPISQGQYKLADREQWETTILTGDVQLDEFWFVVRTWTKSGESRLLDYGKLLTFEDIERKALEWNIPAKAVFLDSAYRRQEVLGALGRYGWLGLNGRGEESYPWQIEGKSYRRMYSIPDRQTTSDRKTAVNTNFSSSGAKDILQILKQGNGSRWEVPIDVSEAYKNAMNSEIKKLTAKGKHEWITVKNKNHWWDCESMQVIAAMMHKSYPILTVQSD
jgi:phage terminase large subunit GpA-like protein